MLTQTSFAAPTACPARIEKPSRRSHTISSLIQDRRKPQPSTRPVTEGLSSTKSLKLTAKNLKKIDQGARHLQSQKSFLSEFESWKFLDMAISRTPNKSTKASSRSTKSRAKSTRSGTTRVSKTASKGSGQAKSDSDSEKFGSSKDPQFPKVTRKNGILSAIESSSPKNIVEIREMLKRPRLSLSPGTTEFRDYQRKIMASESERMVQIALLSLLKDYREEPNYVRIIDSQFTRFPKLPLNENLTKPKPDFYEGFTEATFEPFVVMSQLGGSAAPTQGSCAPALAHFVGEFKNRRGDTWCGQVQAAYDAAHLVYGRDEAATFLNRADGIDNAYVGSFVCNGDTLKIFNITRQRVNRGKLSIININCSKGVL